MTAHNALFAPLTLGPLSLANRIVMAPMTRSRSPGGVPGHDVATYYRQRAAGGVGLIITEGTTVDHIGASGYPDVPRCHGADALAGWAKVVEAVHEEGGKIMPQLWHVGSVRQVGAQPNPTVGGFGPSAVINPGTRKATDPPQVLTESDIADLIAAFARAAKDAANVGFDGVELHGAHGYLIDQFFWAATNKRTDSWGGDLAARTRFASELIAAVRAAVGPDLPIIFRFSQWKMGAYHNKIANSPSELETWLQPLADAGVSVFHASQRRFWEEEFEGSPLNLAGWTRKLMGLPTITVGSVGLDSDFISSFGGKEADTAPIDELVTRLARDEFDLVAVGRALISDPAWANKVRCDGALDIIEFTRAHLRSYP
ncbi:MAG: NADH:flavin oxidoreductase [Myxococcales bacterium]|nr:NADH:flavin oxidoreductase [Myxococcales bacterium]